MGLTFGIEEEFMLLGRRSLSPADVAADAIRHLTGAAMPGTVTAEFLPSQVEYATTVCDDTADALADLRRFRVELERWASSRGLLPLASGTPPCGYSSPPVVTGSRYRRIAGDVGYLAQEHLVNGTHVHIGVDDPEERVRAANGLRDWLPLLLAVSGNSPYWDGTDTGHHSWRAIQTRRWTTNGVPPRYADFTDYRLVQESLTGIGATQRASEASWGIRLSENYPTVEVRVCDAQLRAEGAAGLAELMRTIVSSVLTGETVPVAAPHHLLDAELWHAARFGCGNGVCDPFTGRHRPVELVVQDVAERLELPAAAHAVLEAAVAGRTGAVTQRRARGERAALLRVYGSTFSA